MKSRTPDHTVHAHGIPIRSTMNDPLIGATIEPNEYAPLSSPAMMFTLAESCKSWMSPSAAPPCAPRAPPPPPAPPCALVLVACSSASMLGTMLSPCPIPKTPIAHAASITVGDEPSDLIMGDGPVSKNAKAHAHCGRREKRGNGTGVAGQTGRAERRGRGEKQREEAESERQEGTPRGWGFRAAPAPSS